MEEIDAEKEKFIEKKKNTTNFSENKKIYKSKSLIIPLLIIVMIFFTIILIIQGNFNEAMLVISIIFILILILLGTSRFDYKSGEYIITEFIKDFSNKYIPIDFLPEEAPETIMNDLSILVNYDLKLAMNELVDSLYNNCGKFRVLEKYSINGRDTYLGATISTIRKDYARGAGSSHIIFTTVRKTKLNGRMQIETLMNEKIEDNILYGDVLADKIKYVAIYDLKYFENIEYALSEDFYNRNFQKQKKTELIELDGSTISKLVDIYIKYNIKYQVIIKDNCLRINLFVDLSSLLGTQYNVLYNLEKTNDEIIRALEEYEQNNC